MFDRISRTTTIRTRVDGIDSTPTWQPYHKDRKGKPMKPHAVTVTVKVGDTYGSPVVVTVAGSLFRKNGTVGDVGAEATYETKGGERYSAALPLSDMPPWLAEFVADQTAGLLPDETED